MVHPTEFHPSTKQQAELQQARDHHELAYVRERAGALLKIAAGQSVRQVALTGLLKPRDPHTLADWLQRYRRDGLAGLQVRPGRGRKGAFFSAPRQRGRRSGRSGRRLAP